MNQDITALLRDWVESKEGALDRLTPVVLPELRQLARSHLARQGARHTLQPTEVIHEAFLRLVRTQAEGFDSRNHFYALAAKLIREVLVDHARARGRQKRGGAVDHLPLESIANDLAGPTVDLEMVLAVDEVLAGLRAQDPQQSRVIEMRFFAGLTLREIAQVTRLSLATVERLWSVGRRRLARALEASHQALPT